MIEGAPLRTEFEGSDEQYFANLADWRVQAAARLGISTQELHDLGPIQAADSIAAHNGRETAGQAS